MADKKLVIVESPTKARTIGRILGSEYSVVSSMGHIVDLPKKELGVEIDDGFKPHYVVIAGRKKLLTQLKKEAEGTEAVYVATDPDREGEAIGWHLKDKLPKKARVLRVVFHEITAGAVKQAFSHPREFDHNMIEAQQSRRVLDRIVGYYLSPLLWKKITRGLSAGRVQSVALKLIVEREKKIKAFVPQEYWEIDAELRKQGEDQSFTASLEKINGQKPELKTQGEAQRIVDLLQGRPFIVSDIRQTEKKRNPDPPFITSTLQQDAFNKLRFNAAKTMLIAQQLYEGIDIGEEAPVGLITYMRTDSPAIAQEALVQVREYIGKEFGKQYLPESPVIYKSKKFAQQAHEAIRPTSVVRTPASMKSFLNDEQYELYELIYRRFVASQMNPARYAVTAVDITVQVAASGGDMPSKVKECLFVASGSVIVFDGFTAVYSKQADEENGSGAQQKKNAIPVLEKSGQVQLVALVPSQHFTKPPPRFSDSSLVKALEEEGIGRPSTYAPIISTLILRNYVRRIKGYFHPTELGFKVCDLLTEFFPNIMDIQFTARMEEELDEVEEGQVQGVTVLKEFYDAFKGTFEFAQQNIKKEVILTEDLCDKCGKPMMVKWGRKGKFLSCSGFPQCKNSKSISSGVKCPQPDCGGDLIERRSKRGFFYGCSNFPKCTFTSKTLPDTQAPS